MPTTVKNLKTKLAPVYVHEDVDLRLKFTEREHFKSPRHHLTALINKRQTLAHVLFLHEVAGAHLRVPIKLRPKKHGDALQLWLISRLSPYWR